MQVNAREPSAEDGLRRIPPFAQERCLDSSTEGRGEAQLDPADAGEEPDHFQGRRHRGPPRELGQRLAGSDSKLESTPGVASSNTSSSP